MNRLIHVLNFEGQIIDFISQSDSAIIRAEHNRDINDRTETFDFTILSDRTEHLQKKNRIIIQDSNKQYREFIIEHISQDIDGYTEIETTASYFEDLAKAKPYGPSTLSKMTTRQALSDVLKDTGWEVSDQTEYGGIRTTSWTSYQTRYEVLLQLCTTYSMMADYYIELGNNTVEGRFVVLRERNPMFNGKEITYGKDLIGLKRTVDFSEVKTALLCVGPEKDDGSRIELVVTDDEAQENFGLPGRYSWGIYEPESDDQNMTEARLRTLGTTELNKRKSELISYEVTSTDISKVFKHEVTHLGDMVRIKNRDFTPPLYVEAEVISEQYDMLAEESTYGFGQYKEYRESELRNEFDKKLSDIRQKMHDNISNVNTIIQDTISGELEYYEKKIIKSDTPPQNPVNDALWYDTSNPDVAILRRYWNGEWIAATPEDVETLGGMTREQILLNELNSTFSNLSIQHTRLLNDVYAIINNEYLVDNDIRNSVQAKLDNTIAVYQQISSNLDSMTEETATIGKLMDTQALFLTYRQKLQTLYIAVENAQIAINERFKLLQSQYTQEKFNDAMQKVAEVMNGTFDETTGQLIADIPNQDMLDDMKATIDQAMNDMSADNAKKLQALQEGITQTNQRITSTEEELSAGITSVTKKVDGMQVGGRNLLQSYRDEFGNSVNKTITNTKEFTGSYWAAYLYTQDYLKNVLVEGKEYTISYELEITELSNHEIPYSKHHGIIFYSASVPNDRITSMYRQLEREVGNKIEVTQTFVAPKITDHRLLAYSGLYSADGTAATADTRSSNMVKFTNLKLEEGNTSTTWTPATEDTEAAIAKAQQDATDAAQAYADAQDNLRMVEAQAYADGVVSAEEQRAIDDATNKLAQAKTYAEQKATEAKNAAITDTTNQLKPIKTTVETQSADIKVLKEGITLKADKTEVTKIYSDYITPLQTQVKEQKASLDVLPSQIAAKVSQSQYTADMNNVVSRLNNADSERVQLGNEIRDRVTLNEYNNMKIGTRNLVANSDFGFDMLGWRSVGKSTPINTIDTTMQDLPNTFKKVAVVEADDVSNIEKGIAQNDVKLEIGKEYVLSAWIKILSGGTKVRLQEGKSRWGNITFDALTEWQRYEFKFTAVEPLTNIYLVTPKGTANNKFAVTGFQVIEGNKNTDWKPSDKDTDKRLITMETSIEQNGQQINLKASKDELNNSKKTLSRVLADLTVNTTSGLTLSYDENGSITSHVVGPNGVKIKGDKVDIQANSQFSVLVSNVNNKVGYNEIINKINLSQEGLDINVNNVGIRGGDSTSYVSIKNDLIELSGKFTRTWRGDTQKDFVFARFKDGLLRFRNNTRDRSLYFSDFGISTFVDGESSESSGTLQFFDYTYSTARGVTLNSANGVVALSSSTNRIILDANTTVNIESKTSSVYFRPMRNSRVGRNEFRMWVKDNDSSTDTDGVLTYGSLTSGSTYGSGIRFDKSSKTNFVYATNNNGDIGSGDFYARNLYGDWATKNDNLYAMVNSTLRVTDLKGYNNGNPNYKDFQCKDIQAGSIRTMDGNFYIGVSTNELRITNNLLYNGGSIGYKPIRAEDFIKASSAKFKKDIKLWDYDALSVIGDELQLYSYKYKEDERGLIQHGPVIGDGYSTPSEFIFGDGINTNEMLSWALRAIQQLNEKVKILEDNTNG